MRHYKLRTTAMAVLMLALSACGGGDENSTLTIEGDTVTTTNNNTETATGASTATAGTTSTCPAWASARPRDAQARNVCQLPSTLSVSRTLDAATVWYMADRVTVGNGNAEMSVTPGTLSNGAAVQDVTLTIEPGTQVKAATGTFANLIVTRGSRLVAEGTAAQPIVFSSDDDGESGSGEWGGIILHGYGLHNVCGTDATVACNIDSEGESGFAGGYDAADSSGSLRYVVVTEGGYEFAPGNEINGISLVGVGSGTTMEYIQVDNNADDGVEFYGGSVNARYLVLTGNQDDSIDWDEGYTGNIQFAIVKQSAQSQGNVVEADTDGSTTGFLSKPTLANMTFIGAGQATTMVVLKSRSGGFFHNSVLTTGSGSVITSCVAVNGSSAQANRNTSIVFNNIMTNCGSFGDTVLGTTTVAVLDPLLSATYQPAAAAAVLSAPLDIAAFNAAYPESTALSSFLQATSYIGAVDPSASVRWYEGWTLPGTL
jgi:hypothetical protein